MAAPTVSSTLDKPVSPEDAWRALDRRVIAHGGLIVAECLALAMLYYLMVALSMKLRFATSGLSLMWPSNALLVTTLVLRPMRRWWVYLLAAFPAHIAGMSPYHLGLPWVTFQMFFNGAQAAACAALLSRFKRDAETFDTVREVLIFQTVCLVVPGVLNLAAMYPVVRWSSNAPLLTHNWYAGLGAMWIAGWMNNTASLVTFVPSLLVIATRGRSWVQRVPSRQWVEGALGLVVFSTCTFLVYRHVSPTDSLQQALCLVPIVLLIGISLRCGPSGTSVAIAVFVGASAWGVYASDGPFFQPSVIERATMVQLDWLMIAGPMLVLAAVVGERTVARLASSESEVRFQQLFEQATIGVVIESLQGYVRHVNPAFCHLCGYTERELRQLTWPRFSSQLGMADYNLEHRLLNELVDGRSASYQLERRFQRKDGTTRWVSIRVSLLKQAGQTAPMVIRLLEDVTDHKSAAEELDRAHAELRQLPPRLLQAQEDERRKIARELHDDISQRLALLTIGIDQLRFGERLAASVHEQLSDLSDESKEIMSNVHALSHELHSPRLEHLDLATLARAYCKETAGKQNVQIECSVDGLMPQVSYDVSLCVYRVLQEALHNAIKHSGVQRFVVQLSALPGEIALQVSDTGAGFIPVDRGLSRGLGLVSMRERVRMVGGVISIRSMPAGGTTVLARIPLGSPSR
jgi:PAS domain S-box-containing protein